MKTALTRLFLFCLLSLALSCGVQVKRLSADEQCRELFRKRIAERHHRATLKSVAKKQARPGYNPIKEVAGVEQTLAVTQVDSRPHVTSVSNESESEASHLTRISEAPSHENPMMLKKASPPEDLLMETVIRGEDNVATNSPDDWNAYSVPGMAGAVLLLSMVFLRFGLGGAKAISGWASVNKWKARGMITGIHFTTAFAAMGLGHAYFEQGTLFAPVTGYASLALFLMTAATYPGTFPKLIRLEPTYVQRKMHDLVLFSSAAVMMAHLGNQYHPLIERTIPMNPIVNSLTNFIDSPSPEVQSESVVLVEKPKSPGEKSVGAKVGLTFLTIVIFAGLAYLLAALSCSLSCSGAEALAGLVLIVGGAALIFALVKAIKAIFKRQVPIYTVPENPIPSEIAKLLKPGKTYRVELKTGEIIRMEYSNVDEQSIYGLYGNKNLLHSIALENIARIWRR